jgi:hypothetical protein
MEDSLGVGFQGWSGGGPLGAHDVTFVTPNAIQSQGTCGHHPGPLEAKRPASEAQHFTLGLNVTLEEHGVTLGDDFSG